METVLMGIPFQEVSQFIVRLLFSQWLGFIPPPGAISLGTSRYILSDFLLFLLFRSTTTYFINYQQVTMGTAINFEEAI